MEGGAEVKPCIAIHLTALACFSVWLVADELKIKTPKISVDTTNTLILVHPGGVGEYISKEEFLRHAITNGEVCAIVGHQWQPFKGMVVMYPEGPIRVIRECALCKRTEQQFIEWREVTP
jgi:hypothetical protein